MENFSEVCKIIEAGLEGDRTKLIAYANLLTNKVNERQSQMIIDRITGEYKKKDVLYAKGGVFNKEDNKCPKCGGKLRFIKGAKERRVNTLDGLREWSFNSTETCWNCDYKKEHNDIIDKEGRIR